MTALIPNLMDKRDAVWEAFGSLHAGAPKQESLAQGMGEGSHSLRSAWFPTWAP